MEVLMSGNDKALSMMYLIQQGTFPDVENAHTYKFQSHFQEEGEQARKAAIAAMLPIRASVFNYYVATERDILLYNTLYNAMAWLSPREFGLLSGSPSKKMRKGFLQMGFAVPEEMDERDNYVKWRELFKEHSNHLSLNITTTLKCNAHCPYCYENGVSSEDFDEEKIDALIGFIARRKKDPPVKLNWFGGEPLMNPSLIDAITKKIGERGDAFESHIITNGSLITKTLIKKFKRWHVKSIQITLDGTAENYEKRKGYDGVRHAFQKVLDHIEWVAEAGIHVDIRLNTDHENMDDMIDLVYLLQSRFDANSNVVYYPAFITGTESKLTEREKIEYVKRIFSAVSNPSKLSVTTRLYSFPRNIACMRNDPRSFSVDVYGRVYDCEHLVGRRKVKSIGTLKRFNEKSNAARANEPLREECETCVFLPKCMGGCASNLKTGDAACMVERFIIKAYMEYMCESARKTLIDVDTNRPSATGTMTQPAFKTGRDLDAENAGHRSISATIHQKLTKLEESVNAQTKLLKSLNDVFAREQAERESIRRDMRATEELLRFDLASRLMDAAEKHKRKKNH